MLGHSAIGSSYSGKSHLIPNNTGSFLGIVALIFAATVACSSGSGDVDVTAPDSGGDDGVGQVMQDSSGSGDADASPADYSSVFESEYSERLYEPVGSIEHVLSASEPGPFVFGDPDSEKFWADLVRSAIEVRYPPGAALFDDGCRC